MNLTKRQTIHNRWNHRKKPVAKLFIENFENIVDKLKSTRKNHTREIIRTTPRTHFSSLLSIEEMQWIKNITIQDYLCMLDKKGIRKSWERINSIISRMSIKELDKTIFTFDDIGFLYELGLAHINKISKKELGKYYTPKDVSNLMSKILLESKVHNLADVGVGTGNLIIETLKVMRDKQININEFIKERRLFLYDIDKVAVSICIAKIEVLCQEKLSDYVNVCIGDFLDKETALPKNAFVISNPPYAKITNFSSRWKLTQNIRECKDLYGAFIEKISMNSNRSVIVSPQSFIVAQKFSTLRNILESYGGEIFSFDNVPGTLFNGRKQGVFNTNSSNSVRASITLIDQRIPKGFKLTHLIRFRTEQREEVVNLNFLRGCLSKHTQDLGTPLKMFRSLETYCLNIINSSNTKISDLVEIDSKKQKEKFKICVSTSARYFIVSTKRDLNRGGYFNIFAKDFESFIVLYALLNSSYAYMWYRALDGGILLPKNVLFKIPVARLSVIQIKELEKLVGRYIAEESNYLSYKNNAGVKQESVKFPNKHREDLNNIISPEFSKYFKLVHSNREEL